MADLMHPDIPGLVYQRDLGSGGFADVYLYRRLSPERLVAVKVLRATDMSEGVVKRFTAEANAMAALSHPHIAQVYSADVTADGRPFIEMAYYPNGSLEDRVRQAPLDVPDVLRIGVQLCSAIETAHQLNPPLLHRDIKPANVLIDEYGDPALTDFGIASRLNDQEDEDASLSVYWASPETMFATSPIDKRSDVYSMGAMLWHLLVGHAPYIIPGGDNRPSPTMIRTRDLPVPPTGRDDVPRTLELLLASTMSKDPKLRPGTAADLARSLNAIEQNQYGFARVTPFKTRINPVPQPAAPASDIPRYDHTRFKSTLHADAMPSQDDTTGMFTGTASNSLSGPLPATSLVGDGASDSRTIADGYRLPAWLDGKTKLVVLICAVAVALVVGIVIAIHAHSTTADDPTKPVIAGQAATPQAAVRGYLQALAAGNSHDAISFLNTMDFDSTFMTDSVLAASNSTHPITNIVTTRSGGSTNQTAAVTATYQIGQQSVHADFAVTLVGQYYMLESGFQTVDLSHIYASGIGMAINGASIDTKSSPSPKINLLPGTYQLTVTNPLLTVANNEFIVTDPHGTTSLFDTAVTLSSDAQGKFAAAATSTLNGCMAEKEILTSCNFGYAGLSDTDQPVPSSIVWTFTKGSSDFSTTAFQYDPATHPTQVDASLGIQVHVTAENSAHQSYFGDQKLTSIHIDFSDPDNLVVTFDASGI